MTTVLGIDEAGKGPVVGPLVVCGYLIDEKDESKLRDIGVKDSKLIPSKKRKKMCKKLKKVAKDFVVLKIKAKEIDELRKTTNLNAIEIGKIQEIIKMLDPEKVIIDSMEVNCAGFEKKVRTEEDEERDFICENYADNNYPVVSAASILAKVERDGVIEELKKEHGFKGTGYPSDERTTSFLKKWIMDNKEYPDFVRKSWLTAKVLKEEKEQKSWKDFTE